MIKRIKKHSIIQAFILAVFAFGISFMLFPDASLASKLFMFFMGTGCGVSLSGYLLLNRKPRIKETENFKKS